MHVCAYVPVCVWVWVERERGVYRELHNQPSYTVYDEQFVYVHKS